jgi:hypothetical protein
MPLGDDDEASVRSALFQKRRQRLVVTVVVGFVMPGRVRPILPRSPPGGVPGPAAVGKLAQQAAEVAFLAMDL